MKNKYYVYYYSQIAGDMSQDYDIYPIICEAMTEADLNYVLHRIHKISEVLKHRQQRRKKIKEN